MRTSQLAVAFECTPIREVHVGDRPPVEFVIETIADLEEVDPVDLPPLYESIDPDVLNQLIREHQTHSDSTAALCFTYAGWNIFARASGELVIGDPERMTGPTPLF